MAITQVVTQFPTAPNSLDTPEDFNSKSDAFVAHQAGTYVPEVNELANQMNAEVALINDATADGLQDIEVQTSRAASSASSASNSARDAEHSNVASATSANFKGEWDKDTLYKVPSSVYWKGLYYNCLGDSLDDQPDLSGSIWIESGLDRLPTLAIGNINNPLLDLPLKNSLDMKQGVGAATFTRASTATYIDRYGVMQEAATDEARFEKEGLLIEGDSTNLLVQSDTLVNAGTPWQDISMTRGTLDNIAPDGSNTALKKINNTGGARLNYSFDFVSGTTYTASVFIKRGDAADDKVSMLFEKSLFTDDLYRWGDFYYDSETMTATEDGIASFEKLANGWFRISLTATVTKTLTDVLQFVRTGNVVDGEYEYVWGAQLEEMPYKTSYIPTTTATVTRATEILLIDAKGNYPNQLDNATFSFDLLIDACSPTANGAILRVVADDGICENIITYQHVSLLSYWGGAVIQGSIPYNSFINKKIRYTRETQGQHAALYLDGILLGEKSTGDIHSREYQTIEFYGGWNVKHISNVRYWDKSFTPEEARLA